MSCDGNCSCKEEKKIMMLDENGEKLVEVPTKNLAMSTDGLPQIDTFAGVYVDFVMMEGCEDIEPKKAHHDDAAWDLRSRTNETIVPGKPTLIPTGLFLELPKGYEAQVRPRSGLALKHAITVLNSPGTVDAGYRGEVGVILYNGSEEDFVIKRGDRIAQMLIQRLPEVRLRRTEKLGEGSRGEGGFGSTGKE